MILGAVHTATPIDTLASMVAQAQGKPPEAVKNDAYNIAQGISGLLQGKQDAHWAEAYLNDTARLAWARENQASGKTVDPRDTPVDYIEKWKDAFYGSDHNVPLVKELDQQMIDFGASKTPPGKQFNWQASFGEYGEKGLISRQFTGVDCGPNAFATIARSRGVNMTPQQALPFAVQNGYHTGGPNGQFNGPYKFADMLHDELGLDAKASSVNWDTIDKELAAGRPVTLSGPTHYWVISGKNADGQYYAGQTNEVLGNTRSPWVQRGGFVYGGSYADTMITAKGDVDPNARAIKEMHLSPPAMTMQNTRANLTQQAPASRTTNTLGAPTDMNQEIRNTRQQAPSAPETRPSKIGVDGDPVGDTTGRAQGDETMARVEQWHPLVTEAADDYGVPESVIKGIMDIESNGKPDAGSSQGATGLMQVMPREAGFVDRPTRQQLLDPRTNIRYGTQMLANLYRQYGDWDKASAAYFGALRNGQITDARDATGTSGHQYVAHRKERSALYRR
jgi:hypothetical protein